MLLPIKTELVAIGKVSIPYILLLPLVDDNRRFQPSMHPTAFGLLKTDTASHVSTCVFDDSNYRRVES
jgi:hypothetical protein